METQDTHGNIQKNIGTMLIILSLPVKIMTGSVKI